VHHNFNSKIKKSHYSVKIALLFPVATAVAIVFLD
jgi:hypothetical protein